MIIQRCKVFARRILRLKSDRPDQFDTMDREIAQIYRMGRQHITKVEQPLVMISQIQRSGGSLLSQLFDGHPECHVHPSELNIGFPQKWNWPKLDLDDSAEDWFEMLFERQTLRFFRNGYSKNQGPGRVKYEPVVFRFLLLPNLQRELFKVCVASTRARSQRDILNCYMTSYFNAWLDYHAINDLKKYVVAFVPRMNMFQENLAEFFAAYPDGKLISSIRDPKSWYASARRHDPDGYQDLPESIELWKTSARAMLEARNRYGDKVCLICFEKLLQDTPGCMRLLADALGIAFDEKLLTPTFQGMPIQPNTTFAIKEKGVMRGPLNRHGSLTEDENSYIEAQAVALYHEVLGELDETMRP